MKKYIVIITIISFCSLNILAKKSYATVLTSSLNKYYLKNETKGLLDAKSKPNNSIILNDSIKYQKMEGFGAAITYASAYNLLKMSKRERTEFLKRTYSKYNFSYARVSIGCCDFSSEEYTCCDSPGLNNFSLHQDETKYIIPILKEILKINPRLKIMGSPWTCPQWMKVNNLNDLQPFNSWTDGHLNPAYYQEYADYFVKWIRTMKKNGIRIYAITPQNEPLARQNCASLYMPWEEETAFVKILARTFKRSGLKTKIYVFDHNYNYDNVPGQEQYPIKMYNSISSNDEGYDLIAGAAYHDYYGTADEMENIYIQEPTKQLILSETSIGKWNNGRILNIRLIDDMNKIILSTVNHFSSAIIVWNLMLDTNSRPNLSGGCTHCYGAVDLDAGNYSKITYNSHYYILAHIASVVSPSAIRIGSDDNVKKEGLNYSAFLNPDGSHAIILCNSSKANMSVPIYSNGKYLICELPSESIVSIKL